MAVAATALCMVGIHSGGFRAPVGIFGPLSFCIHIALCYDDRAQGVCFLGGNMSRNNRVRVNVLICALILAGFLVVGITSYITYSEIIRDDVRNITKLTTTNIYSDIRNELTKPIFVALTMANDDFVKTWLRNEKANGPAAEGTLQLQNYLLGIRSKYDYDSVFLVSQSSKTYYHYEGINKVLDAQDSHDVWYDNFLARDMPYDLEIDTDQVNKDRLSVFINCRITDQDNQVMGVTGVGLETDHVQKLLQSFEEDFHLKALLFDSTGTVRVHTGSGVQIAQALDLTWEAGAEKTINVFTMPALTTHRQGVLDNRDSLQIFSTANGYVITRYIEDLNWYLLVQKDTSVLEQSFHAQLGRDALAFVLVALFVLLVVNRLIRRSEGRLVNMARVDPTTGLLNRRGFNEHLERRMAEGAQDMCVFVFDIDNFKRVNDQHGHLIGDKILRLTAEVARRALGENTVLSRWGGDEYAGIHTGGAQQARGDIDGLLEQIRADEELCRYGITISMGATVCHRIDSADALIYRADEALYDAKGAGKDRCIWIDADARHAE